MAYADLPDKIEIGASGEPLRLKRTVGFWGLSFVSLGSIIGSGWLLGALVVAETAGGASLISWVIGIVMMTVLALIHADLGAAYPVAGGTARYPYYAFGAFIGFVAGWVTFIQAIAIAPIEVVASIDYTNAFTSKYWALDMLKADGTLSAIGLVIAAGLMGIFAGINLLGAKVMSESSTGIVLWKLAVPVITIVVLLLISFHPENFVAGGGFLAKGLGWHGVFAALPIGVVFSLQGFEQATQMAGEAENPQKHVAKAIILAMAIGGAVYLGLEIAFIGALDPKHIATGWSNPLGLVGNDLIQAKFGPYYSIFLASGIGFMAVVIIIDAVISPFGTGLIYVGTTARISYALGLPRAVTLISDRGVPWIAVLVATILGYALLLIPGAGWQQLVALVTGATAIMYSFAPIALRALTKIDADRVHPYRSPVPSVLLPFGFACGCLLIYWGGWDATWKILVCLVVGFGIFGFAGAMSSKAIDIGNAQWRSAIWLLAWLGGLGMLSALGNYGDGSESTPVLMNPLHILPEDWDAVIVGVFGLAVFYLATSMPQPAQNAAKAIEDDLGASEISGTSAR